MNSIITEFNVRTQPAAIRAWAKDRMILIELSDFSIVAFPADSFRLLKNAAEEQLWNVEIRLNGIALRWEELDEDITVAGILDGRFQLAI